jgi:membrane-associated phospholipid phosphatase
METGLSVNDRQLTWYRQAAAAMSVHIYLKSIGTPLFIGLFFVAYFFVLNNPPYPVTLIPVIFVDRLIAFQPLAFYVYITLWVYVSLPPALLASRRELYGYGAAMAGTCLTGLVIFFFWPTAVSPADIDWARYPDMNFLKNLDAGGNACPSLHVATAVFSGIWLHRLLRRFGTPSWLLVTNGVWCAGIVYSTIAIRQHVALDVLAGLALGLLAARLSLRIRALAEIAGSNR